MTMTNEEMLAKYPGSKIGPRIDNSEWVEGVKKGAKILNGQSGGKTFIMLDKKLLPEENLTILKKLQNNE